MSNCPKENRVLDFFLIFISMAVNPFARMTWSWLHISLCFFLLLTVVSSNSFPATLSYADHCSSFVPESSPTTRIRRRSVPDLLTTYFTDSDKLLGHKNDSFYYMEKSLRLRITPNCHETIAQGIYKVEGFLSMRSPYAPQQEYRNRNDTTSSSYAGSYYHRRSRSARGSIRFQLTGFWSEVSRKLCMVGYASEEVDGIRTDLDAVLKVNFAGEKPNIYTGVVSGILESISPVNDPGYFDPISIFQFPELSNYTYSLVSGKVNHPSDPEAVTTQSPSSQPIKLCSMLPIVLVAEDAMGFPLGLSTPFLAMNPIQCSGPENKIRFIAKLQNKSYIDEEFGLEFTLIGEASWDDNKNELSGIACRLLSPADNLQRSVGDCTMMLSLKYNLIWTLRNEPKAVGQTWSTKKTEEAGFFQKVNLTSFDPMVFPDMRYEYSELGRVKESCPMKKTTKKRNLYPDGHSYDMRFDTSVMNSKGEEIGWGYANPISVGSDLYNRNIMLTDITSSLTPMSTLGRSYNIAPTNISYKLTINSNTAKFVKLFPNLNLKLPLNSSLSLDITAEGVYDIKNGYVCMVGCGKFIAYVNNSTRTSTDCEILVKFQLASLNDTRGDRVKGTIESGRKKGDPLYFEDLSLLAFAYSSAVAERSIWRMDLEITMVLISNTLLCVFIGLQILHVKRNPEVLSKISLFMIVLLSLGHMVPLVLNFEAVFTGDRSKGTLLVSSNGWLEANEVAVRLITMVAFLFQIRLLQLVWVAKQGAASERSPWSGESKSIFITSPLYILGGLIALLLSLTRKGSSYLEYSLWGDLRSYAGLILDGFLFPQILLNVFCGSGEKALAHSFYVGTSGARLVPHAYNQYRARNYPTSDVNGTYYYANPAVDFYSTAWDVLIPLGVIGLAVIVFLQQKSGGRWILPRRFRELELYEKVPTVVNE